MCFSFIISLKILFSMCTVIEMLNVLSIVTAK